jgi:protein-S-isoprenylcysteine O-methyltransferase Ste14
LFWTAYALWLTFEISFSRTKRVSGTTQPQDRGSFRVLMVLYWTSITSAFFLSYFVPQAAILWNRSALFFIGLGLMLGGVAFRWYAMSVLGRFFTFEVAVHSGQTVIEAGPYRYIRHPSYTGAILTLVGLGFALGNWAALLVIIACMAVGYSYRISVEEAALVAALGEPYKQYMRRTRRLIPFLF